MLQLSPEKIKKRLNRLTEALSVAAASSNAQDIKKIAVERRRLENLLALLEKREKICREEAEAAALLKENDEELTALATEELEAKRVQREETEKALQREIYPGDPHDERGIFLEIRAGTGGEEAALFVTDLLRMYQKFAERKKLPLKIINKSETGLGGLKEVTVQISAENAFRWFKYERGTHRVQRVPKTESQGRIHTSAATVAVLPIAEDVDVQLKESELKIEAFRASGAGGQHVNKTSSAIRITHLPTGLVVSCQDERSQYQNKMKALQILRSHLLEKEELEKQRKEADARRAQVGSGDRSEKIRTYNFPQDRVSDHRLQGEEKNYPLSSILDGDLIALIEALQEREYELFAAEWMGKEEELLKLQ